MTSSLHASVLLNETIQYLDVQPDEWYIDATFGRGGHTRAILEKGGKVCAFDCDDEAISYGQAEFEHELYTGRLILIHQNFTELEKYIHEYQDRRTVGAIAGILFDFGVSSPQLDSPQRGFSFQSEAPLDMRMDRRLSVQAKDFLQILTERQLTQIFIEWGGEHEAKRIARAIVMARTEKPFTTTKELADFIAKIKHEPRGRLHPATKVFQALRIAVNSELQSIQETLPQVLRVVRPGGRIVTIAFHEGEDRLVKTAFRQWEKSGKGQQMNKDVIIPTTQEVETNTRARSAKLRGFIKKEV